MTDREAYVAFNLTDNVGSVGVEELVSRAGSVAAAWEAYPKKLSRLGGEVDWKAEFDLARRYHVTILTPADPDYPPILLKTRGHPLVLYVMGDVKALAKPGVALVGTRRATTYGLDRAHILGHDLAAAGLSVVSGLALGIDAEAHRGALEASGTTVGILGSGLDRFYPEQNRDLAREIVRKGGAVVSEFPFGRDPDQTTFPQRNHIVAALGQGVVAIEAPVKSGTLITTSIAADLGRVVMAVPGRVDSRSSAGCLHLIREGATLVRDARDVLEALGTLFAAAGVPENVSAQKSPSTPRPEVIQPGENHHTVEEALLLRHVDVDGISLDRLVDLTGYDAAKVSALAMTLRLKGVLRFMPGNRVALPRAH